MTTKYTVPSPDGHSYDVEAPDDASQEDILQHVQGQHQQQQQPTAAGDPSTVGTFAAGMAQGAVLDPIEGIGQLTEHIPYVGAIPRWIGNSSLGSLADRFRNYAQSTTAGQVGELGGAVGSMFLPLGAIARGAGLLGRASRAGEAAEAGLQGVRSATTAGPHGYAAVRRELEPYISPGTVGLGEADVRREVLELAYQGGGFYARLADWLAEDGQPDFGYAEVGCLIVAQEPEPAATLPDLVRALGPAQSRDGGAGGRTGHSAGAGHGGVTLGRRVLQPRRPE